MSAKIFKGVSKVRRKRRANDSLKKILAEWIHLNPQFNSIEEDGVKQNHKPAAKGSKKGCMRGKGGPQNSVCKYRGVRQRTWGRWVAEIRMPINCIKPSKVNTSNNRLWLGTFDSALEAALAYDLAARTMYCSSARVNFSENEQEVLALTPESTTTSGHLEVSLAEEQKPDISEFCEMKMEETVTEVKDGMCRPIIHNKFMTDNIPEVMPLQDIDLGQEGTDESAPNFNNGDYFQSILTDNLREVMPVHDIDLRQEGTGETALDFNDNGDYFQSLMTDNIRKVMPLHDIDLRREETGESALNFNDNEDFQRLMTDNICELKPLHDIDVRQEGTDEPAPLDNSILTQQWDNYSGPFEDLASIEDGMSHSNPFRLSYNDHLDDWRPLDFSYQLPNTDDKQFDSASLLEYFFPGMGFK